MTCGRGEKIPRSRDDLIRLTIPANEAKPSMTSVSTPDQEAMTVSV
jgi:hypothetical protein